VRDNPDHLLGVFEALDGETGVSQRALARRLGIALGTANQLLRRMRARRWIDGVRGAGPRIRYVVTADGHAARTRMTHDHLRRALASYGAVHARVRAALSSCIAESRPSRPSIVIYGTGAIAQIAFACAADLGVRLAGFVDDEARGSFLGLPVRSPSDVRALTFDGRPFDWLLVASFGEDAGIRRRLESWPIRLECVRWL